MGVKCKYCGATIDIKTAYKYGTFYYCNRGEYDMREDEKHKRRSAASKQASEKRKKKVDPIYEAVADIFEYRTHHSVLFQEMNVWREICKDEVILAYLSANKPYLTSLMKKDFKTEYQRIRYFSAVLKNNLVDYKQTYISVCEPVKTEVDNEMYEPIVATRKKRKGLSDLEDEV